MKQATALRAGTVVLCGPLRVVVLAVVDGLALVAEIIERPGTRLRGDVGVGWDELGLGGSSIRTVVRCGKCQIRSVYPMNAIGRIDEALLQRMRKAARCAAESENAERGPAIRNLSLDRLLWLRGRQVGRTLGR